MNDRVLTIIERMLDLLTAEPVTVGVPEEVQIVDPLPTVKKERAPWGSKTGKRSQERAAGLIEKVKTGRIGRPPKERHYVCNDCMNDFHASTPKLDTTCPQCDSVHISEL